MAVIATISAFQLCHYVYSGVSHFTMHDLCTPSLPVVKSLQCGGLKSISYLTRHSAGSSAVIACSHLVEVFDPAYP